MRQDFDAVTASPGTADGAPAQRWLDGVALHCGTCTNGRTCGGGGPVCGTGACTPITCAALDGSCGIIGDGCGGHVDCGMCAADQVCGAVGAPNQCQTIIVK